MKIPEEIIEQIRQQSDIVEVVGEEIPLRKRGQNYVGLCPFHNEKTPSFNVSPERQIYKCFGCGKAGNAINFVMEFHGLSFPEALKSLAGRLGIQLPEDSSPDYQIKHNRSELAYKVLEEAAEYFATLLFEPVGLTALNYFRQREFSTDTIKKFKLGFAPDSWDATGKELIGQGFNEKEMLDAGLLVEKENGRRYDRFRGRAIFAIRDFLGRVVGFGARQLTDEKKQAKYINSPQSIVYNKSKVLYGLFEAKNSIRNKKSAILVEGYSDVISLFQAGIENVVASSGTALTPEQLKLLSRYTNEITIIYDSDSAGMSAAEKGLELAVRQGFDVNIVSLPDGEDPDSIVRNHGKNTFNLYLRQAESFVEFKLNLYKKRGELESPAGQAKAIRDIVNIITMVPDRLQHDFHISRMANLMNLNESQIKRIYDEKSNLERSNSRKRKQKEFSDMAPPPPELKLHDFKDEEEIPDNQRKTIDVIESLLPEEYELIQIALGGEEALGLILNKYNAGYDKFITDDGQRLFKLVTSVANRGKDVINIIMDGEYNEVDTQVLTQIAFDSESPTDNWTKYGAIIPERDDDTHIRDILLRLELILIDNEKQSTQKRISEKPDEEEINILLTKTKILGHRKNEIEKILLRVDDNLSYK